MYNYYKNSKESLLKDFIWNPKSIKKPNAKHKKQWSSPHWQQKNTAYKRDKHQKSYRTKSHYNEKILLLFRCRIYLNIIVGGGLDDILNVENFVRLMQDFYIV